MSRVHPSPLSPPTPMKLEAKFGMHNPHMDGSKVTDQTLIFCLEAEIFKFYVIQ